MKKNTKRVLLLTIFFIFYYYINLLSYCQQNLTISPHNVIIYLGHNIIKFYKEELM